MVAIGNSAIEPNARIVRGILDVKLVHLGFDPCEKRGIGRCDHFIHDGHTPFLPCSTKIGITGKLPLDDLTSRNPPAILINGHFPMPLEIPPLISIGAVETVISDDGPSNQLFRDHVARVGAAPLKRLLEPRFAQMLDKLCAKTGFVADIVPNIGIRQIEAEPRLASKALCAALRRRALLRWLSDTTGCGPLETVGGAITELTAHHGEALDWHEDEDGTGRKLAITINLSEQPFEGGGFELRERASHQILFSHVHQAFGSALLFRVSRDFQHRVLPVTSGGPRRVFSGWFLGPTAPAE